MGGIDIDISVLDSLHIHFQPPQVIPGNKQLHAIAVAVCRVDRTAFGGSSQASHNIIGGCHIGISVPTVAPLEEHITGRQQIYFKHIVFPHTCYMRSRKIYFDTAVHIGCTFQIHIDGYTFCHIKHKVHTLLTKVTSHSNVDIIAAIVIVQIQPVVFFVGFLVQNTVNYETGICFSLGFIRIDIGIFFFRGNFQNAVVSITTGHNPKSGYQQQQ